jgi:branched-chain amino acid transport system substrate-binding protein
MSSRFRPLHRRSLAVLCSFALLAAACGDDDDDDGDSAATGATAGTEATTDTTAESETTEAPGTTAAGGSDTTAGGGESGGSAGCPEIDDSIDAEEGVGAGRFISDLTCGSDSPLAAEGEPIVIGFQNPEGDPNGSFPEFTLAAEAAVEYINTELGGFGADIQNGIPGRPIELAVCKMAISPDDSQRCANELLSEDPFLIVSSINFFGNQIPIYQSAGVPGVVITPITIADFTSEGVYSIGGGGGCLGVHTGLVEFATTEFGDITKLAVPWADTPPGVVCYYDLENKPIGVLNGSVEGTAERAGTMPDLTTIGVQIKPATPDITPQVTEVLGFDPDVIIFSAQGADCWNLVDGLGRLGWTPDQVPLVLSTSCLDFEAMRAAGDLAKGIYMVGAASATTQDPAIIENPRDAFEAEIYQTKAAEYGLDDANLFKGFAAAGFAGMMILWERASDIVVSGDELAQDAFETEIAGTAGEHAFGSTPISCSTAPEPYVAVCNAIVAASQWDGEALVPVRSRFTGVDLVAGTELTPGP